MNTHHIPRTRTELEALAQAFGSVAPTLLGHLRWCHHTPTALIVVVWCAAGHALATVVVSGAVAQVLRWLLLPTSAMGPLRALLLEAVEAECAARGVSTVVVQCAPAQVGWWQAQGFVEQVALETWVADAEERYAEAEREEVQPLDAAHTLALLHLYQTATGAAFTALLREHTYAGRAYDEGGRIAGILLPLLGHGLIVARHATAGLELQRWLLPVQAHLVVPEGNVAAAAQLQGWGYTVASTSVRLVRGALPPFRAELVYAWPW